MALTAAMVNLPPTPTDVQPPTSIQQQSQKEDVLQTVVANEAPPEESLVCSLDTNVVAQLDMQSIEQQNVAAPPVPIVNETPSTKAAPPPPPTEPVMDTMTSPALSNTTPNHVEPSPNPSLKSNGSAGKKSPSKPTRSSARVITQQQQLQQQQQQLQQSNKSPSKSPGKSPRQQDLIKGGATGRGRENKKHAKASSGRGSQSQSRGRGRGRGRGRPNHAYHDFHDFPQANTIHNKLIGTVYDLDFDEDISNEMGDLRAMRERRKSGDHLLHHERKSSLDTTSSYLSRDSSESPKFTSPGHGKSRNSATYGNADLRDLRPPTPIVGGAADDERSSSKHASPEPPHLDEDDEEEEEEDEVKTTFPKTVEPVLPGPVDMRTYSSNAAATNSSSTQPSSATSAAATTFDTHQFNEANLLGAFGAGGAAERPVHDDLDENFENELQSALSASLLKQQPATSVATTAAPVVPTPVEAPTPPPAEVLSNIKVSLSDSRNQLKVKIKGPIANYTSTVAPLPPVADTVAPMPVNSVSGAATNQNAAAANFNSGTSTNLRRMRKKELLRQYWTQDMNMDDGAIPVAYTAAPVVPSSINRTIITIPKAVASMTTIPTKEDYRDYRTGLDDYYEASSKHVRKENKGRPGLSRELRQLDIGSHGIGDDADAMAAERRRSVGSNSNSGQEGSSNTITNRRRGRPPRLTAVTATSATVTTVTPSITAATAALQQPTAPKLKIKISSNSIVGGNKIDEKRDRIRPPKKRLSAVAKPSVEDLKRESMKFRKLVMADFGEKREKKKKDKKNKKKRKLQEIRIIEKKEGDNGAPPKLIIRLGKPPSTSKKPSTAVVTERTKPTTSVTKVIEGNKEPLCAIMPPADPLAVDPLADCVDIASTIAPPAKSEPAQVKCDKPTSALRLVRTNKLTPIKLKLSRCHEGSGYVTMKSGGEPPGPVALAPKKKVTEGARGAPPPCSSPGDPMGGVGVALKAEGTPPVAKDAALKGATAPPMAKEASEAPPQQPPVGVATVELPPSTAAVAHSVPLNKDCEVR